MSDQPQGGQPVAVPEDPQYQLQQHISFKRKQQILNHTFKTLIQENLSEFDLIMDGTNYAFTKLALENKGVQQITQTIYSYPHLRKIDMGFNQLKQINCLQKLKFITQINLQRNFIEDIKFLQSAQLFPYLKKLNLQGNQVKNLPSIQLRNIVHLNLNHNQITTLQDFQGHPKLQVLELRKNNLSDLKGLTNLLSLRQLYLAENNLTNLNNVKNLPKLLKLHIRKNKIQALLEFPQMPSLKYLNLRQNLIKGVDNLKGIPKNVEILNLLACPLSEQMGDNTKKQVWMKFRNFQRINKSEVGAQEKADFDKEYKDRLAEQQRERLEKQAAQRQARQAAQKEAASS